MPYTYATLLEEVTRWLDAYNDPAFVVAFPGFLRQTEERIYTATRIQPYRQVSSVTIPANGFTFRMPDNYTGTIAISLISYGGSPRGKNLLQKNTDYLTEVMPAGTTGEPIFYAIQGENSDCVLAPIPNQPIDLIYEYYGKPPSLADVPAGQTTWVSRNAEATLLQGVLYYAYLYEKGEDDMTAKYLADFDKGLLLLFNTSQGLMRKDDYRSSPQPKKE